MLLAPLNAYLARALESSPRAKTLCHALDGRRLRIEIEAFPDTLELTAEGCALKIRRLADTSVANELPADVTVRGSPLGLLSLAKGDASETVLRGGATVIGDEMLTEQFQELARLLRPDFEAEMGRVTGRIPAHLAARGLELLGAWGRLARESVARNTADYLAHESRDLVPRAEAEVLFSGIEALRSQVSRADARIAQLAERIAARAPRSSS
jgi:ubiquinone biosynthesis protein UbiJ